MVPVQLGHDCCCKLWNTSGNEILRKEIEMNWLRKLIEYNLIARMTMLASVLMSWRCAEWFMNLEDPTMQQSAFVSVIMGVMTGIFGIWMGQESRSKKTDG